MEGFCDARLEDAIVCLDVEALQKVLREPGCNITALTTFHVCGERVPPMMLALLGGDTAMMDALYAAGGDIHYVLGVRLADPISMLDWFLCNNATSAIAIWLMERGAKPLLPSERMNDNAKFLILRFIRRKHCCESAAYALLSRPFRNLYNVPKDIAALLAASVWESRRQGVWDTE